MTLQKATKLLALAVLIVVWGSAPAGAQISDGIVKIGVLNDCRVFTPIWAAKAP
jgi:hypothetical protein